MFTAGSSGRSLESRREGIRPRPDRLPAAQEAVGRSIGGRLAPPPEGMGRRLAAGRGRPRRPEATGPGSPGERA